MMLEYEPFHSSFVSSYSSPKCSTLTHIYLEGTCMRAYLSSLFPTPGELMQSTQNKSMSIALFYPLILSSIEGQICTFFHSLFL